MANREQKNVSHDEENPVIFILGFSDLLIVFNKSHAIIVNEIISYNGFHGQSWGLSNTTYVELR